MQIKAAASQTARARIPFPDLADPRNRAVINVTEPRPTAGARLIDARSPMRIQQLWPTIGPD